MLRTRWDQEFSALLAAPPKFEPCSATAERTTLAHGFIAPILNHRSYIIYHAKHNDNSALRPLGSHAAPSPTLKGETGRSTAAPPLSRPSRAASGCGDSDTLGPAPGQVLLPRWGRADKTDACRMGDEPEMLDKLRARWENAHKLGLNGFGTRSAYEVRTLSGE